MERPDKWKRAPVPTASEISLAAEHPQLDPENLKDFDSAGLKDVTIFATDTDKEKIVKAYLDKAPGARLVEQEGVSVLHINVREGNLLVSAQEAEGETLVCELLLPQGGTLNAVDWVKDYQKKAREQAR